MKNGFLTTVIFLTYTVTLSLCQQQILDYFGDKLDIKVTVLDNLETGGHKHKFRLVLKNTGNQSIQTGPWAIYFYSFFMLEPDHLPSKKSYTLERYNITLSHVKGSLFRMEPTSGFEVLEPSVTRSIEFYAKFWAVSKTDIPPNWYVAQQGFTPVLIKSTALGKDFVTDFTSENAWKRYRNDQYNPFTAQERFRRNVIRNLGYAPKKIIPTPKTIVFNLVSGFVNTSSLQIISSLVVEQEAKYLAEKMGKSYRIMKGSGQLNNNIMLDVMPDIGTNKELYILQVNTSRNNIIIVGQSPTGVFYGIQSLLSLLVGTKNGFLSDMHIEDEPRFEFRGMHVDVARHFRTKADLIRLMDVMAMYKLNKLHLHLSDDEGWRLEIPGIPELTEVGGKRCHDLTENECLLPQLGSGPDNTTSGSGFYSVSDFTEIISEAAKRHIEVIPELDMPGHVRAAVVSMEARYKKYEQTDPDEASRYRLIDPNDTSRFLSVQMFDDNAINPCIESTFIYVQKIIAEVKKMHPKMTTFHFGGDEVPLGAWVNSSKCKNLTFGNNDHTNQNHLKEWFAHRVSNIANKFGLNIAGWEDGFIGKNGTTYIREFFPNSEIYVNPWQNIWEWDAGRRAYDLANAGYKVIIGHATHLFFDHPYEPDPEERGLYWATRFTDTRKVFHFLPDRIYENIATKMSGEVLTRREVCGVKDENCPALMKPKNIIGIQGQGWSETVFTSENFDYMMMPRLLALAERAWHKASWEYLDKPERDRVALEDWEAFANTLGHKELRRLDDVGVKYRISLPGAELWGIEKHVMVNVEFPGLTVEFSEDDGKTWKDVDRDATFKKKMLLRTRYISRAAKAKIGQKRVVTLTSADGKRSSRAVFLDTKKGKQFA